MQLRFNTLVEQAGLDPDKVYLLRHEDDRLAPGRLLSAWLNEREKFEGYQAGQKWKNQFSEGSSLASFVVTTHPNPSVHHFSGESVECESAAA